MRLTWIQVIVALSLTFVVAYEVLALPYTEDVEVVSSSSEPEQHHRHEISASSLPVEALIKDAVNGNSNAAAHLVLAGSSDSKIILHLLKRLETVKGRPAALAILARIGSKVTPHAVKLLHDEKGEVRWSALRLLVSIDHLSPSIALDIARCLKDEDVWVRRWAAMLLGQIDNEVCVSELVAACRDDDAEVRWRALRALYRDRSPSDLSESILRDALADRDPDVRYIASRLAESNIVNRIPQ